MSPEQLGTLPHAAQQPDGLHASTVGGAQASHLGSQVVKLARPVAGGDGLYQGGNRSLTRQKMCQH